jgi:hypothetical protein
VDEARPELAGRTVSVCPACGEPAAVWPQVGEQVVVAEPWVAPAAQSLDELIQSHAAHQARCHDREVERQIRAHAAQHAPDELLLLLADTRNKLRAVHKLVQNAQVVSPSARMTVYVGDLLTALGLGAGQPVPTKNDAANPPVRLLAPWQDSPLL